MTFLKVLRSLCALASGLAGTSGAYGSLLAYEGFDYDPGGSRLHQVSGGPIGGFGWTGGWTNFGQGTFLSNRTGGVGGVSLDPGFTFSGQGRFLRSNFGGDDARWIQSYRRLENPISFDADGIYFISILLRGSSVVNSDALVYLQNGTTTDFNGGVVRFGLGSQHSFGGQNKFTLRVGGSTILSEQSWAADTVYLAVLKIAAAGGSDDLVSASFFSATEPVPDGEPETWLLSVAIDSPAVADWIRFHARGDADNLYGSDFDEIRVGSTWESVTPTGILFVSPTGSDEGSGRESAPFRTITRAAELAQPGDIVHVKEGVYRERVAPPRGGTENYPIVYRAEPGKNVFLKGSDIWEPEWEAHPAHSDIFYATVDGGIFKDDFYWDDANPFQVPFTATPFDRDGYAESYYDSNSTADSDLVYNLGQIFVNGERYQQQPFVDEVSQGPGRWSYDRTSKRIYVRFPNQNPEEHTVEITTRRTVFAPHRTGLGHIHLQGFIIEHAANQYPRDFWMRQEGAALGAVDTRFGHNWTIENNVVRYASGMGIQAGLLSLDPQTNSIAEGAGRQSPNNHPGGIIIRNNHIVDNGGGGIIASSARQMLVEGNVILRNNALNFIGTKRWESAGVKVHNFIDSQIIDNYIGHNLAAGIWFDNRWQGVNVSRNVIVGNYYNNESGRSLPARRQGIFLEKSLNDWDAIVIDHNILLENRFYGHNASGATFVHNLVANIPPSLPGLEMRHLNDPDSRSDKHTVRHNLFLNAARIFEFPYPAEQGGPIRVSDNVYGVDTGSRSFAPTRWFRVGHPNAATFYFQFLDPDLGVKSPGIPALTANDGHLTLEEWRAFWAHHGLEVDAGSLLTTGASVTYQEDNHRLNLDLAYDPESMDVVAGPFSELVSGQNEFTLWNGLPLLAKAELPRKTGTIVTHRPTATEQTFTTLRGRSTEITLRGQSETRQALLYSLIQDVKNGILSGSLPHMIYSPNPGFTGEDVFTFRVTDGQLESDLATITIRVVDREPGYLDRFETGDQSAQNRWLFSTWAGLGTTNPYRGDASMEITRFGRAMGHYNLLGMNRPTLTFFWRIENPADFERAFVKIYDGEWHTVLMIDSPSEAGEWQKEEIDLAGFNAPADFRVLFEGFSFGLDHTWFVDEIAIQQDPLLAYEGFEYGPISSRLHEVGGGPTGGFGWLGKWTNFVEGTFLSNRIRSGSLDPGFPFIARGERLGSEWGGTHAQWLQTYRELARPIDFGVDGTYYLSLLLRGSSIEKSDAFVHLQDSTEIGSEAGEIQFGLGSAQRFDGLNSFVLRVGEGPPILGDIAWEAGVVYLGVVKLDLSAEGADTVSASFFRTDHPLPRNEPSDWMLSGSLTSDSIQNWIRLNASGNSANAYASEFDEVRIGLSWKAVTPEPSISMLTYETWRSAQAFFSFSDGEPLAEPTGGGVPNLLSYALGLDPLKASRRDLPVPALEAVGGETYLALLIPRNESASDVDFFAQVSTDLVNWESGEDATTVVFDAREWLKVRDNTPVSKGSRRFLRFQVELRENQE